MDPSDPDSDATDSDDSPEFSSQFAPVASATGGATGAMGYTPNMIGDTVGGACGLIQFNGSTLGIVNHPTFGCSRQKIAENNSPMPRDRAYITYQHFHNAILNTVNEDDVAPTVSDTQENNIDRFIVGVEKTFMDGLLSVQVQVPIAFQLSNTMFMNFGNPIGTAQAPGDQEWMFGNLTVAVKALLASDPCTGFSLSGGVMVETPTAKNVNMHAIDDPGGPTIDFRIRYENESVFIAPFLGFVYQPNERFFLHGFSQIDFDAHNSDLHFLDITAATLDQFEFKAQTLLRMDLGAGYWIYRNPCARRVTGVSLLAECHYSTTISDADLFTITPTGGSVITLGNASNRVDIVNMTFGSTLEYGRAGTLTGAVVLPVSYGDSKPFDAEYVVQLNMMR